MMRTGLTPNEENAVDTARRRVRRMADFFANNQPPESSTSSEWYAFLARFKDELGNFNNDVSFFATLMAKEYLVQTVDVVPFDAAEKAQGAPGLDIAETTTKRRRVIAEIKTTHPYKADDLGAQQLSTFRKDAGKLKAERAEHKFFFVTDRATFELMKKRKYRDLFAGIRVVLLPSGEEIAG